MTFERVLGNDECYRLTKFDDVFPPHTTAANTRDVVRTRLYILKKIIEYVVRNPKVIIPGIRVTVEILQNYYFGKCSIGK